MMPPSTSPVPPVASAAFPARIDRETAVGCGDHRAACLRAPPHSRSAQQSARRGEAVALHADGIGAEKACGFAAGGVSTQGSPSHAARGNGYGPTPRRSKSD